MTDMKPLQPLSSGIVLLIGVKASNFDEEIRTHPRVVMWSSQEEHWHGKDLPSNTRAVFLTRFLGHSAFTNIVREARKRQITIFNPMGTGIIARQVKELLSINRPLFPSTDVKPTVQPIVEFIKPVIKDVPMPIRGDKRDKLKPLHEFVDFNKTNIENARALMPVADQFSIKTTLGSLAQMMVVLRKRKNSPPVKSVKSVKTGESKVDVSVEILDGMIKELQDMRQFLIATVEENKTLKLRMDSLKKALGE